MERLEPAKTYQEYLPEIYRGLLEIKTLAGVIDVDMSRYYELLRQFVDNRYIMSMDTETVQRWESIFDIASPIKDDLQSRRQAIQAKFMSQPPINLDTLKRIVEAYLGVPVSITQHLDPYVVRITYRGLEKLPDLTPLYTSIYDTIPANIKLVIEYAYQLWIEVKNGNTWEQLKNKTWHDVLYGL